VGGEGAAATRARVAVSASAASSPAKYVISSSLKLLPRVLYEVAGQMLLMSVMRALAWSSVRAAVSRSQAAVVARWRMSSGHHRRCSGRSGRVMRRCRAESIVEGTEMSGNRVGICWRAAMAAGRSEAKLQAGPGRGDLEDRRQARDTRGAEKPHASHQSVATGAPPGSWIRAKDMRHRGSASHRGGGHSYANVARTRVRGARGSVTPGPGEKEPNGKEPPGAIPCNCRKAYGSIRCPRRRCTLARCDSVLGRCAVTRTRGLTLRRGRTWRWPGWTHRALRPTKADCS